MPLEELSAKIYLTDANIELNYFPINVSKDGISIFTNKHIPANTEVTLELSAGRIPLKVVWCQAKENDPAVFRCGLKRIRSTDELDTLIKDELSY